MGRAMSKSPPSGNCAGDARAPAPRQLRFDAVIPSWA
jgi:hypothetical protein